MGEKLVDRLDPRLHTQIPSKSASVSVGVRQRAPADGGNFFGDWANRGARSIPHAIPRAVYAEIEDIATVFLPEPAVRQQRFSDKRGVTVEPAGPQSVGHHEHRWCVGPSILNRYSSADERGHSIKR